MNRTTVERKSDREVVVTRTFDAPVRLVFEAWSKPELFKQWCGINGVRFALLQIQDRPNPGDGTFSPAPELNLQLCKPDTDVL